VDLAADIVIFPFIPRALGRLLGGIVTVFPLRRSPDLDIIWFPEADIAIHPLDARPTGMSFAREIRILPVRRSAWRDIRMEAGLLVLVRMSCLRAGMRM
jgi:hypothetical protein